MSSKGWPLFFLFFAASIWALVYLQWLERNHPERCDERFPGLKLCTRRCP